MAKATAICTCATCGAEFEKTAVKQNRRDANDWKDWAERNYDQCPKCWGAEQRKKERETPMYAEARINPYDTNGVILIKGNTMPRKDDLKTLGYMWGIEPMTGAMGIFSGPHGKCWYKIFAPEDYIEIFAELESLNIEVKTCISDVDRIILDTKLAQIKEAQAKIEEQFPQITKPECPDILKGCRWNKKIYGRSGNYSIYPNGDKTVITDEQAAEIKKYLSDCEEYQKKIDELKQNV